MAETGAGQPFWARTPDALLRELGADAAGLAADEAARRRGAVRPLRGEGRRGPVRMLLAQLADPMMLMLVAAAVVSFPLGATTDGAVIVGIVLISSALGVAQEWSAANAVAALRARVAVRVVTLRDGRTQDVPADAVVPGDVVLLSAGSMVPGDALLLEANALHVDEAALTGESLPAEKRVGPCAVDAAPGERSGALFLGTHVVSGTCRAVVVAVGQATAFGAISAAVAEARPVTSFELSLQRFGRMLSRIAFALVVVVFLLNAALGRPALDALLFSLALAVGLVPELLPVIVSVSLAQGARRMAKGGVIVKRPASIEDFGAVDVLCSDKTGTLTEGRLAIDGSHGPDGAVDDRPLALARTNAWLEAGYTNPIDAVLRASGPAPEGWRSTGEVPYDFERRRLSVAVTDGAVVRLVTKGAFEQVLALCTRARRGDDEVPIGEVAAAARAAFEGFAGQGRRVLAVATRTLDAARAPTVADEADLVLEGLITVADPPRADARATVAALGDLGIRLVLLTGDARLVAARVAADVTGRDDLVVESRRAVAALSDEALRVLVGRVDVFAEVDPAGKERIVRALRAAGHVVAYVGDGINDVPPLHAADVGISVDRAVDVAKAEADVVLLDPDLAVLVEGVREGRRTSANSLKYVAYTTSANFGNMVSMAVGVPFLPFLPLLPAQILLNNFLSDFPTLLLAGDAVEDEQVRAPERWDLSRMWRFMVVFGGVSSVFDLATFGALLALPGTTERRFQTGWFLESLLTEIGVLLVLRTRRPLLRSRPARALVLASVVVAAVALALPWVTGDLFSLARLPPLDLLAVLGLVVAYLVVTELTKALFYRRQGLEGTVP